MIIIVNDAGIISANRSDVYDSSYRVYKHSKRNGINRDDSCDKSAFGISLEFNEAFNDVDMSTRGIR